MGNNNRKRGNSYERDIAQLLNKRILSKDEITGKELRKIPYSEFKLFPKLGTSRELSRALDARKVDIALVDPDREEEFPYLIQAKSLVGGSAPYHKLLDEIVENNPGRIRKGAIPAVFHRQTEKKGEKFFTVNEFACLYMKDFLEIIFQLRKLQLTCKNLVQDTTENS